jgi:hypothetical protein
MFSQFHLKAIKSRCRGAFSFALRESQLLDKAVSWIQPFGLAFRAQEPKLPNTPLITKASALYVLINKL